MMKKQNNSYPKFAVVGHPNKGKSSIVSALALDDSVQIGDTPGTTQVKRSFPLKVDGKIVYELFDTPGFQRARRVLGWLEEKGKNVSADKRSDIVRDFIREHREDERFKDEVELLEPILDGAGILYVVDASKPYGPEYEVEMEILRWCGQPSMAILNLIGKEDYREQWKRALGYYFRMVRTFNPMEAVFKDHLNLLEAMAQLKEEWVDPIKIAIKMLHSLHTEKVEQSVDIIFNEMFKMLTFVLKEKIKDKEASLEEKKKSQRAYRIQLLRYERDAQQEIELLWHHRDIEKIEASLLLDEVGLFSKESASIFGLSQKDLVLTGASAGAITGAGVDLLFVGHTLFLGAALGGLVGGAGAIWGFENLYSMKIMGQKLGKRELSIGPMQNMNFPYVVLGRAIYHASIMITRSHARRDDYVIEENFTQDIIDSELRKKLEKIHILLRKGKEIESSLKEAYKESILKSLLSLTAQQT